jgi:hypothetical protein
MSIYCLYSQFCAQPLDLGAGGIQLLLCALDGVSGFVAQSVETLHRVMLCAAIGAQTDYNC